MRMPAGLLRRLHDWLSGSPAGLVPLALLVGAGAGAGAVAFRYLVVWCTRLFTGRDDYSAVGRVGSPHFPGLGAAFVVVAPAIGGLVYGPIVQRFAREARGHGVPEVMLAVAERGGRIGPQVAVVKSLASALCIGSGGSVGREGPIVQVGSALGSAAGQLLRLPENRLRLMVACGAAGGISATFNAPIAGVFFALELILRDFATESFGVVVLASVTAAVIGRAAFGDRPFLDLPAFHVVSVWEYPAYALLGLMAAVVGVGFVRVLYGTEDLADRIWAGPEWLRPGAGGLLLGLLLLGLPQLYGVGYPVLSEAVGGHYGLWLLGALLLGKIAATSLTIAVGGSGGVFAPSLFMGAMLGSGYGQMLHHLAPASTAASGAYGLIGMGAVFAGAARAPITAVLIIFEVTGDYTIVLPLMVAVVLSAGVSNLLSTDTIYTLKLRRRGIDVLRGSSANLLEILTVAEAMSEVPEALPPDAPLAIVIDRLAAARAEALPVIHEDGTYLGTLTALEAEQAVRSNALDTTATELARALPTLRPEQTLNAALSQVLSHDSGGLPVVTADRRVVGWLGHLDILQAYNDRLTRDLAHAEAREARRTDPTAGREDKHRTGHTAQLAHLQGYRVVDLILSTDRPPAGLPVSEVAWPSGGILIALRRDGHTVEVDGSTELAVGDRLSVLVPREYSDDLDEQLRGAPR
ncbi:MAG TPA: chloride channel protein [Sporichthyaceae bacterium]|jgi:CIC family chloride channel protein|nr:chloride channel protein [Sporichthyaceae bacterium]